MDGRQAGEKATPETVHTCFVNSLAFARIAVVLYSDLCKLLIRAIGGFLDCRPCSKQAEKVLGGFFQLFGGAPRRICSFMYSCTVCQRVLARDACMRKTGR